MYICFRSFLILLQIMYRQRCRLIPPGADGSPDRDREEDLSKVTILPSRGNSGIAYYTDVQCLG